MQRISHASKMRWEVRQSCYVMLLGAPSGCPLVQSGDTNIIFSARKFGGATDGRDPDSLALLTLKVK